MFPETAAKIRNVQKPAPIERNLFTMQTLSEISNHFQRCPLPFHASRITTVKLQQHTLLHPVRQSGFRESAAQSARITQLFLEKNFTNSKMMVYFITITDKVKQKMTCTNVLLLIEKVSVISPVALS